jgi:hypothetical protein
VRKCKHCREYAKNGVQHPGGWFCTQAHAIEYAIAQAAKQAAKRRTRQKREDRQKLERLKSLSEWLKEAQAAVNRYVRLRDRGLPCVSCDRPDDGRHQRHASHYRSTGNNPALRFDLRNIHASCATCNSHLSGNLLEYRKRLIGRIGQGAVDWLEGPHEPAKWTVEQAKEIRDEYRKRCRELEKQVEEM